MNHPYKPKSKKQEHLSPDPVYDAIYNLWHIPKKTLYDPFPPGTPYKAPCFFNAFYGDWGDYNYVNSPYETKTLDRAVYKAIEQSKKGRITFMLCPAKTDQNWYHRIVSLNYIIVWFEKRLKFKNNKHHATDSHFLVMIK